MRKLTYPRSDILNNWQVGVYDAFFQNDESNAVMQVYNIMTRDEALLTCTSIFNTHFRQATDGFDSDTSVA